MRPLVRRGQGPHQLCQCFSVDFDCLVVATLFDVEVGEQDLVLDLRGGGGGPLLAEHFPALTVLPAPANPAEQIIVAVRLWLAQRLREHGPAAPGNLYQELLRCVEPALMEEVIRRLRGNRWVAAQWLGLNRATVRKKLNLYGLSQPAKEDDGEPAA